MCVVDKAKAAFQNMKKVYNKRKNELKIVKKSENLREFVQKAKRGFKSLDFPSLPDKHFQLKEKKSNFSNF